MPRNKLQLNAIAKEFIANGMNASQAVMKVRPNLAKPSAQVMASRMLHNDNFKQEVNSLLPKDNEDLEQFNKAFNAKTEKSIKYSDLAKFLELSLKAKGKLGNDNAKANTNIGIIIEK